MAYIALCGPEAFHEGVKSICHPDHTAAHVVYNPGSEPGNVDHVFFFYSKTYRQGQGQLTERYVFGYRSFVLFCSV